MKKNNLELQKIVWFVFIVFFIDSIFHFGRFLKVEYVRFFLWIAMLMISSLYFIINRTVSNNIYLKFIIPFMIILVCSYFKTYFFDAEKIPYANIYIKGFMYLLFYPILVFLIKDIKQLESMLLSIIIIGTGLSILTLAMVAIMFIRPELEYGFFLYLKGHELVTIFAIQNGTLRIMWTGVLVQLFSFFFSFYFALFSKNKINFWIALISCFTNAIAILFTYSRGMYLGMLCGVICLLFVKYKPSTAQNNYKKFLRISLLAMAIGVIVLFTWRNGSVIKFIFVRLTGGIETEVQARETRNNVNYLLREFIFRHPLLGSGAGAGIAFRDGFVENTYKDMIGRLGLIGFIIFLMPFVSIININKHLDNVEEDNRIRGARYCILASLVATMIVSATNPYLITSFGMFIYCMCMRVYSLGKYKVIGDRHDGKCNN